MSWVGVLSVWHEKKEWLVLRCVSVLICLIEYINRVLVNGSACGGRVGGAGGLFGRKGRKGSGEFD